jgi:hypothetical protein
MELHIIKIRLPGNLTQQDFQIYGLLTTTSWLRHLWEFCDDSNIQLTATTPKLLTARAGDKFLMDIFAQYGYRKHN